MRLTFVAIALAASLFAPPNVSAQLHSGEASCPMFPGNNIWNAAVDKLPVHPRSSDYVASIGTGTGMHPDFGSGLWDGGPIGIPYTEVPGAQPMAPIDFDAYPEESDPGPYPVPATAPIEGGSSSDGDRHVLVINTDSCLLYELYRAFPQQNGSWTADSGAVYNLRSHALRPDGWTSADAAGLPIYAGLVRYEEIQAGVITHALRFTAPRTQRKYVWPARHFASSSTDASLPPMGQRFRLRADFNMDGFSPETKIILRALQTYGMMLADNGSAWYLSGAPDSRWNNDTLVKELKRVRGADFEAVDVSRLMIDQNSGQARSAAPPATRWIYMPAVERQWSGTIPPSATD